MLPSSSTVATAAAVEDLQTCELPLDVGTTGGFGGLDTSGGVLGTTTGGWDTSTSSIPDSGGTSTGDPGTETTDDGGIEPPTCGGACDACIECAFDEPCAGEAIACATNPGCLDLNDCYADCDDNSCYDLCDALFPEGVVDFAVLTECILGACESC